MGTYHTHCVTLCDQLYFLNQCYLQRVQPVAHCGELSKIVPIALFSQHVFDGLGTPLAFRQGHIPLVEHEPRAGVCAPPTDVVTQMLVLLGGENHELVQGVPFVVLRHFDQHRNVRQRRIDDTGGAWTGVLVGVRKYFADFFLRQRYVFRFVLVSAFEDTKRGRKNNDCIVFGRVVHVFLLCL